VKANRAYDLVVRRGGRADRFDAVEIVEIASGEVVLFWDTLPEQTGRLARALRADLSSLEPGAFLGRWQRYEGG
jgi:hypothetical protein